MAFKNVSIGILEYNHGNGLNDYFTSRKNVNRSLIVEHHNTSQLNVSQLQVHELNAFDYKSEKQFQNLKCRYLISSKHRK